MKKFIIAFICLVVIFTGIAYGGTCGSSADGAGSTHCTGSTPWTSDSASDDDVRYCIATCMSRGETLNLPSTGGNWVTWDKWYNASNTEVTSCTTSLVGDKCAHVTFNKSIRIIGAGAGSDSTCNAGETCIKTSATTKSCNTDGTICKWVFAYKPSSISDDSEELLRISGIHFDTNETVGAVYIANWNTTPLKKVRIDNNVFTKNIKPIGTANTDTGTLKIAGIIYGVVDQNRFNDTALLRSYGPYDITSGLLQHGRILWDNFYVKPGTEEGMYYEDNLSINDTLSGSGYPTSFNSASLGVRQIFRYNTHDHRTGTGSTSFVEGHGNQTGNYAYLKCTGSGTPYACCTGVETGSGCVSGANYSTMHSEVYGNEVFAPPAATSSTRPITARGGSWIVFNNRWYVAPDPDPVVSPNYWMLTEVWNEYADAYSPTNTLCTNGRTGCGIANPQGYKQPQQIDRSYFWNNNIDLTGNGTNLAAKYVAHSREPTWNVDHDGVKINSVIENTNFFNSNSCNSNTNCQKGVGCGSTLPSYCTTGTGFWLTTQSCTSFNSYTGSTLGGRTAGNVITGSLYRCSSTNNWSLHFTPLQYPHPLREEGGDTDAPNIMSVSPTTQQACTGASEPYTQDVAISLTTNENATVKWGTSSPSGATNEDKYTNLPYTFTGSGTQTHSATASGLACGSDHTIYYIAKDASNNYSALGSWTFNVSAKTVSAPVITNLSVQNQACSVWNLVKVGTDVPATCRYCINGVSGCTSSTAWSSRTQFTQTGGDIVHHEVTIPQPCSSSSTINVLCQNTQGSESSNMGITIITDALKIIRTVRDSSCSYSYVATDTDTNSGDDFWSRLIIPANTLSCSGNQVRITLRGNSANASIISGTSIGVRSGTSDDTVDTPVRITWAAANGKTLSTSADEVSDWIVFPFTRSNAHLVHVYMADNGTQYLRRDTASSDANYYNSNPTGDETLTAAVTATGSTPNRYFIVKIEVQ